MEPRPHPKDVPADGNPVVVTRHILTSDVKCDGIATRLWCPGCQALHMPRFRCSEHDGPRSGPVWDGNPYSDPFEFSPSLKVEWSTGSGADRISHVCHSFVRGGQWEFLGDSTHYLAGRTVPLEPLPNWLA